MIRLGNIFRLLHIRRVLLKYGLDEIVAATHLFRPLRILRRIAFGKKLGVKHEKPRGERIRLALIELGPVFVKFGQALSTRRDLLPLDIADELAKLQDRVPPFPGDQATNIIEQAYGHGVDVVFDEFQEKALAAASIAQVHTAKLKQGQEVVVKLLRPGVKERIEKDLRLLHQIAALAQHYWEDGRRLRPREVVEEYEKTILDELDLMREAANAAQLRRNFENTNLLYVPEIYWDLCRPDVLVMERIHGVPISNVEELKSQGTNMQKLAENGVEIFFTQVFRHNFFHADMHPGNIFVNCENPEEPRYVAVDFGIVGTLSPRDQHYLAENFLAFFNRDYQKVAKLHLDSGWVPSDTRVDEFESAIRTVSEPIFNKPLKDISFGHVLLRLFQTARRFNMEVQPQLVLLQKTLLNIEGLGRELYPELDLWKTAYPILQEWMAERLSGRKVLQKIREQLPELGESLQVLPQIIQEIMQKASDGRLVLQVTNPELDGLRKELDQDRRKRFFSTAAGATLIAGSLLLSFGGEFNWLGWVFGAVSLGLFYVGRP